MNPSDRPSSANHRILVIDDMQGIHDDFRKVLCKKGASRFDEADAALFDAQLVSSTRKDFVIDSAYQGMDGVELVRCALAQNQPYTLAFIDVRMPPGWDGIETARRIWEADPNLQIVICSAYSDYSWDQMSRCLGETDSLVFLKKPFDTIEVMQLVHALTTKWSLARQARQRLAELDALVAKRTEELLADISVRKQTELRLAAFASLGSRLSAAQNAKAAAAIVVGVADQLLGWDACFCASYSQKEDSITHVLAMDIIGGQRMECNPADTNERPAGMTYKAIHEGGQLVLRDNPEAGPADSVPFGDKTRRSASILFVPIRNDASVIGMLSIQSYKPQAYDQRSLETLQALADHCGGALNRIKSDEVLHETELQLRQAQKMEAIGQLAGGVAHDFNNLLAVILGNTELARSAWQQPGKITDWLKDVVDAANRGANLTRQLLAFSRKQVVQAQRLDLNKHISNLDKMLRRMIGEDVEFKYKFEAELPFVQADPGMLDQVIMNLVVNSRDAMPNGGHLHILTQATTFDASSLLSHPEARPGHFVCVSVTDTGTGIAPEHMAHVFEPFFTTKGVGKGTGLGLATVFGIVKQHCGWVEVTSAAGIGTTFKIFLPALDAGAASVAPSQPKTDAQGGHEVVLMVEDDDAVRLVNRRVLEEAGYRILEASCGQQALDVWDKHGNEVDLLLTDLMMPGGMNGRDLAERLIALRPNLKIVFMSGYNREILSGDTTILRRSKSRFLNKPCKREEFLRVIRDQLDGRENRQKPATNQVEHQDMRNHDRFALQQA